MRLFARHGCAVWNLVRIDHDDMNALHEKFPGKTYPVCYTLDPFHVWPTPKEGVIFHAEQSGDEQVQTGQTAIRIEAGTEGQEPQAGSGDHVV